jgi:hypothetical protein
MAEVTTMGYLITDGGLKIPEDEARRCETYPNPNTSEVSEASYSFAESLSMRPSCAATIVSNGETLARSIEGAHWSLTPAGQRRLGWEASLLKERWAQ